jgi:hypothetical protein
MMEGTGDGHGEFGRYAVSGEGSEENEEGSVL